MAGLTRVFLLGVSLTAICVSNCAADVGIRVTELLRQLQASGISVLYSSDLVSPDLAVVVPTKTSADPLQAVSDALVDHGLMLKRVAPQQYIVTRAPPHAVAVPPSLSATNSIASSAENSIQEVSVYASRYTYEATSVGEPLQRSAGELERMPGSQEDALRAIRTSPGLATNLSTRPYIRGALLDDVLVQFDGVSLLSPFHFKSFQSLISAFDPASVGRIDVYTGGFPVKFGTRSAGVLDVAPRSVQTGYENRFAASLLSYDLSSIGRAESRPLEWLFAVRHSKHDIVLNPINDDIGTPMYFDALGRVRLQVDADHAWTVGWLFLDDRIHIASDQEQALAHDRDLSAWIRMDLNFGGSIQSQHSLSLNDSSRSRSGQRGISNPAPLELEESRKWTAFNFRSDWLFAQSEDTTWHFGALAFLDAAKLHFERQETFDAFASASNSATALSSNQAPKSTAAGVYADIDHRWQRLEFRIGGRIDSQHYLGFGTHSQFSPRANLAFDLSPQWRFYGSWGQFTQAQRVGEWRVEENQSAPDPVTQAEHLIAGVDYSTPSATLWKLEFYRNHWRAISPYYDNVLDPLVLLPELGADRIRLAPNSAETAGVELSVHRSFDFGFDASASYVLSRATDDLGAGDVPRSWNQPHAASIDIAWQKRGFLLSTLLNWHEGWPRTPVSAFRTTATANLQYEVGARNSARWQDYLTQDIRASQTFSLLSGEMDLWVDVTNLTNHLNECCTRFDASLPDTAPVTNTKTWLSRIINVGFSWRFGRRKPNRLHTLP